MTIGADRLTTVIQLLSLILLTNLTIFGDAVSDGVGAAGVPNHLA